MRPFTAMIKGWPNFFVYSKFNLLNSANSSFEGLNATVYCNGYLEGTWLSGETFSKIRFIDRFCVSDMKITSQSVWNDMGERLR